MSPSSYDSLPSVDRIQRHIMKRYRVYLAKSIAAPPDVIEMLAGSHAEALESAVDLIADHWALEVWQGTLCIGGLTRVECQKRQARRATPAQPRPRSPVLERHLGLADSRSIIVRHCIE